MGTLLKGCMPGACMKSGSATVDDGGKGYSKRGEASKGVPTMEEGECSERSDRLKRGLSTLARTASLCCASDELCRQVVDGQDRS